MQDLPGEDTEDTQDNYVNQLLDDEGKSSKEMFAMLNAQIQGRQIKEEDEDPEEKQLHEQFHITGKVEEQLMIPYYQLYKVLKGKTKDTLQNF